jgi:hypothetical protein
MFWGGQVRFHLLVSTTFVLTLISTPVFGCTCVRLPPGNISTQELVQNAANSSDAVFEGRVERVELKWALMEAKVGDAIPASVDEAPLELQVSFDAVRSYKGAPRKSILVTTGIGGGDCGFDFEAGKQYLVYAFADKSGQLSTGICSRTALLDESKADLSYLRGEPITSESVAKNARMATGKLCGRAVRDGLNFSESQIFILRIENKSPIPSDEAELANDGSFCVTGIAPGKYHLLFVNPSEGAPTTFLYFPGVAKPSDATAIEIKGNVANPDVLFNIPLQATFSVSGTAHVSNKSALPAECKIGLLSADPQSFQLAYSQDVAPNGSFDFPQVLPGKYWAFVAVDSDASSKWLTKKVEVNVEVAVANLSLQLILK